MQRVYWRLRNIYINIVFKIKRFLYKKNSFIYDRKCESSLNINILIQIGKQITLNLLIIIAMFILEPLATPLVCNSLIVDNSMVTNLLIAMVSVAGVFLGLYCTNMMSIFSTKYANAPKQLSALFENDLLINDSIKSIANFLIFNILILIISSCGKHPGFLLLIICCLKSIKIIVSYSLIGKRTFQLADTYHIAELVYKEFYKCFNYISKDRVFSKDTNFQEHCKKVSKSMLEILNEINEYNVESPEFRNASMEEFMDSNLVMINNYWNIKQQIPYNSNWFAEKTVYKKWYSDNDSSILTAIGTGTSIGYEKEKDYNWFETELINLNKKCLKLQIESNTFLGMYNWINNMGLLARTAIKSSSLSFYIDNIKDAKERVIKIIKTCNQVDTKHEMAFIEALLMLYIDIIIEIGNYVKEIDIEKILNDSVRYSKIPDLHKYYKFFNQPDVFTMYTGISAEVKLEGERITPDWYVKQLVAKHIYDEILDLYIQINRIVNEYVPNLGDELIELKKYAGAMMVYTKMSEIRSKAKFMFPEMKESLDNLEIYHVEDDKKWRENSSDVFEKRMEESYKPIPTKWSKCASEFILDNWEDYDEFPDLLGQCYNYVCEFLIIALEKQNFSEFSEGFKNLWGLVLIYQEVTRKELIRDENAYNKSAKMVVFGNPIIDYGYISGYAYILGDITGDEKWKVLIEDTFEKAITEKNREKEILCEQIVDIFKIPNDVLPAIYNRDIIHTNWKLRIDNSIKNMNCLKWKKDKFMEVLVTDSKLLRAVIRYKDEFNLLRCDAYEIFAVEVVNKYITDDKKYISCSGWEKWLNENW